MRKGYSIPVDTEKVGDDIKRVIDEISTRVIGQQRAMTHIMRLYASGEVGLRDPTQPIGAMTLAGPSGCGKTLTAKETARAFLGSPKSFLYPLTYIQCENFVEKFQISSLIGSSPGYVGYGELPILHWFNIEKYHLFIKLEQAIEAARNPEEQERFVELLQSLKRTLKSPQVGNWQEGGVSKKRWLESVFEPFRPLKSLILFDEIEKAPPQVWNLLLGIIEDGELQLATGEMTDFRNSFIIMTTNVGSREIQELMDERKIGFPLPHQKMLEEDLDQAIYEATKRALEKMFPTEFVGRLEKEIVVFRTLNHDDYLKILEIFLSKIQSRLKKKFPFPILINYAQEFKEFLVKKGTSQKYGARLLRGTVKKHVESPITFALSSGELVAGDKIFFDLDDGKPVLRRQPRPTNLPTQQK